MKVKIYGLFVLGIIVFALACRKDIVDTTVSSTVSGKAMLKVVFAMSYTVEPKVQLKVNDERVSSILDSPTPFPGGGLNTGGGSYDHYMALPGGTTKLSFSVPNAFANTDSVVVYNGSVNIAADKKYTVYVTDTSTTAKQLLIEENTTKPADLTTRYKFINIVPNSGPLDLWFDSVIVATAVPYLGTSAEFVIPRDSSVKIFIRPAGSAVSVPPIYTYPVAAATLYTVPKNKVMTIFANGYIGGTANRAPVISLLYN